MRHPCLQVVGAMRLSLSKPNNVVPAIQRTLFYGSKGLRVFIATVSRGGYLPANLPEVAMDRSSRRHTT